MVGGAGKREAARPPGSAWVRRPIPPLPRRGPLYSSAEPPAASRQPGAGHRAHEPGPGRRRGRAGTGQETVVEDAVWPTGSGSGSSSSAEPGSRPSQRPITVTTAVIAM